MNGRIVDNLEREGCNAVYVRNMPDGSVFVHAERNGFTASVFSPRHMLASAMKCITSRLSQQEVGAIMATQHGKESHAMQSMFARVCGDGWEAFYEAQRT